MEKCLNEKNARMNEGENGRMGEVENAQMGY